MMQPGTLYGKDTDFSLRTDDIPGASPVKNPHLQKVLLNRQLAEF